MTNNLFDNSTLGNKNLTIGDLYVFLENMLEKNPDISTMPVLLVENIFKRGAIVPTIRHLEESDINLEKDLQLVSDFVLTQFDRGLILGYVTKTEE